MMSDREIVIVYKKDLTDKVTSKQRTERNGASYGNIQKKRVPGRGNSQDQDPKAEVGLACARNNKKASVTEMEVIRGQE